MNKQNVLLLALVAGLTAGIAPQASADETNTFSFTPNLAIPDNSLVGVADAQSIASPIFSISSVSVTLNISGGFVGDLYGYLAYGNQIAVLLNREGRTGANSYGYADSGMNITLTDGAANGDLHSYRLVSNPNGGVLTGTWAPDARNVHPYSSLDTTPRSAFLNSFTGLNPNGTWTLYLADVSPVATATLNGWSLEVVGQVPEPSTWALMGMGGMLALWLRRRKS